MGCPFALRRMDGSYLLQLAGYVILSQERQWGVFFYVQRRLAVLTQSNEPGTSYWAILKQYRILTNRSHVIVSIDRFF